MSTSPTIKLVAMAVTTVTSVPMRLKCNIDMRKRKNGSSSASDGVIVLLIPALKVSFSGYGQFSTDVGRAT